MKRKKRIGKAVMIVLGVYLAVMGTLLGILKTTHQTRYILYGGQAVVAQCMIQETAAGTEYTMQLGGGEWSFSFLQPETSTAAKLAEQLPPCTTKLLLRMVTLAEYYTDYIADCIKS